MLLQRKNFASRQPQTIKSFFLVIGALTNGQKQAIRCTPKNIDMLSTYIIVASVQLKFIFSSKDTKFDEIFTVNLTLCSKCQIDGEDFVDFFGLLRKHELYHLH